MERSGTLGKNPPGREPRMGRRKSELTILTVDQSVLRERNMAAWARETTKVDAIELKRLIVDFRPRLCPAV